MICERVNATIFKKKPKQGDNESTASISQEYDLSNLYVGQEILIIIKNIKYEQNDLFLTAIFHSIIEDNKME